MAARKAARSGTAAGSAPGKASKRAKAPPKPGTPARRKPTTPKKPATRRKTTRTRRPDAARVRAILQVLDSEYGESSCALEHENAYELLIATILSAQCTDARVNIVTRTLFKVAPDPKALAGLPRERGEDLVRSTGFFRNKAKSLKGCATRLVEEFRGRVPKTMDELLTLPGVARKTANVVLGTWYGIADGIVVDTHVTRISRLLGLTRETDPKKIELDLVAIVPKEHWIRLSHQLIEHGRKVCIARRPRCADCALAPHCPSSKA